jgi:anti-sigma B factor antagonist
MRYDELTIDGVNLVLVHGDIAGDSRRRLVDHVRALLMDGRRRIVLDLSAVRHVDSRGLGELIECYEAARAVGGDVKLLGVNGRVSELLVITKLVSVFECYDERRGGGQLRAGPGPGAGADGRRGSRSLSRDLRQSRRNAITGSKRAARRAGARQAAVATTSSTAVTPP